LSRPAGVQVPRSEAMSKSSSHPAKAHAAGAITRVSAAVARSKTTSVVPTALRARAGAVTVAVRDSAGPVALWLALGVRGESARDERRGKAHDA